MYYTPSNKDHGLLYDPLLALVVPRPIGWISTVSHAGAVNLAPYSFFNLLSVRPPYVMFSSYSRKDSLRNAEETGEFVCNLASYELRDAVNLSSAPVSPAESEPALLGLEMLPSRFVRPPRVARAPAALECRTWKSMALPGWPGEEQPTMLIGEVVGIFIDESIITEGLVDLGLANPIARLGYRDYGVLGPTFTAPRPVAADLRGQLVSSPPTISPEQL